MNKMKIQEATKQDLLDELERREKVVVNNDHFLCIGIIDNEGVDSFVRVDTKEKFAELHSSLSLRSRFNSHRNPVLYAVNLTQPIYDDLNSRFKQGECEEVAEELKQLSTFKNLGY